MKGTFKLLLLTVLSLLSILLVGSLLCCTTIWSDNSLPIPNESIQAPAQYAHIDEQVYTRGPIYPNDKAPPIYIPLILQQRNYLLTSYLSIFMVFIFYEWFFQQFLGYLHPKKLYSHLDLSYSMFSFHF